MLRETLSLGDIRVSLLRAGQGLPVYVLLHGGGLDSAELSWGGLILELARAGTVIAPDWPGYGESQAPGNGVDQAYLVAHLGRLLDGLGLEQSRLVGLSMGGGAALGYALATPARVERLTLVASYGLQTHMPVHPLSVFFVKWRGLNRAVWRILRQRPAWARLAAPGLFHNRRRLDPHLLDLIEREAARPNAGLAWMAFQESEAHWARVRTCYLRALPTLQCPLQLIHGQFDGLVPVGAARVAAGLAPRATLAVLPAGHWTQREQPEAFLSLVRSAPY